MRFRSVTRALLALSVLCVCASAAGDLVNAQAAVRLAELHYDNTGTDTGEAIEISGPAGTSVDGWQIVLYNGSNSLTYNTHSLSGTIPATCGARGVIVVTYPTNGIQNGNPDAIALVDAAGGVVEFLSYGGTISALNGPAAGMTSTDIGVSESSGTGVGQSLQRGANGTWNAPAANTFGACNDDGNVEPPAPVATITISPVSASIVETATQAFAATGFDSNGQPISDVTFVWTSSNESVATVDATGRATGVSPGEATITAEAPSGVTASATLQVKDAPIPSGPHAAKIAEIHYDNDGVDAGEAIEIEAAAGTDLSGWSLVLYNGSNGATYNTSALTGFVPATCDGRGVIVVTYPVNGIQNGPDAIALVDADGQVVEFLSYEGTFVATNGPAVGFSSTDIGAAQNSAAAGRSLQRYADNTWSSASSTFGQCNGAAPPVVRTILITGRSAADPALPVGFQDQLFATLLDGNNVAVPTTFTWTSETPEIATIDQRGVVTALAEGTAVLRATAADGTTMARMLPTRVAVASTTALYVGNAAFGEPADNDPSDDIIIRYPQFIASFNPARGTSNWVAYELDPTHFGAEDRCDCFTFDPTLPAEIPRYTTADYTGAGAFHDYGIDRGHLARSFDRTAGSLDNARTFYFSNIIPQAADLNQGPWAEFENYLGNLARTGGKEVYILTGVAGEKGTIKNEGRIVIPASTWKVAVIMPADAGLADVVDYRDLDVIAVTMPNEPGVRDVNWETYMTTVDAIEALTGYDLLALLEDKTENAVESNTKPPFAIANGPYSAVEGSAVTMSAATSFDPNGSVVSYTWLFGDGASATGPAVSHAYAQDGAYTVTLVVSDNDGLSDTITTTATVSNAAPAIAPLATPDALLTGETFAASGSFADAGADEWTATVDYGEGDGATPLVLDGQTFALSHLYASAGTFTVTVAVTDDDVTTSATTTVTVLSGSDAIRLALTSIAGFESSLAQPLAAKLTGAIDNIEQGQLDGAVGKLQAAIHQLDAFVGSGRLSPAQAAAVSTLLTRTIQTLTR